MQSIGIEKHGILLEPTKNNFEQKAVLNPGAIKVGNTVHLYYRAIDAGLKSCIGYARLEGPTTVVERWEKPLINRELPEESRGIEDPRIVRIGSTHYMTYVAHDGKNAVTAYATTNDLMHFEKKGVISPRITYDDAAAIFREKQLKDRYFMFEAFYEEFAGNDVLLWSKDLFFFPSKIRGTYALLQRILPDIQVLYFNTFDELQREDFWRNYLAKVPEHVVLENRYWFESRNIGGGAPPISTKDGWLVIFHSVEELNKARIYHASAALLDKNDPTKVIGRLDQPLFSPDEVWEKQGFVSNVVFPTGTAIFGDILYICYGAADTRVAVASLHLPSLLQLLKQKKPAV